MRIPRDLSGDALIKKLSALGYRVTRQTGSHVRVSREVAESAHHVTIPRHGALRVGTLNGILNEVAAELEIPKSELLRLIS